MEMMQREVKKMPTSVKTIAIVWTIAIACTPLMRLIGRIGAEEDGDILCIVYMIYALIVSIIFTCVIIYVCKVLS